MWWPGRGNSGGSWLPEEKKANMWPGRGNSGGSWPPAIPRSLGNRVELDCITENNFRIYLISIRRYNGVKSLGKSVCIKKRNNDIDKLQCFTKTFNFSKI